MFGADTVAYCLAEPGRRNLSTAYPHLLSPIKVGRQELRNRICLPATLTNFGAANRVTDRWSNFLVERARGGAGMLVSEIIAVDPNAVAHGAVITGFEDENLPALTRTATAVKAAGAKLVGQLWHPGRQQLWHPSQSPMGVSDQPDAYSWTVPHVMSEADLARVAAAYVSVATRLADCGFSGVELHGAHGYLITQLLSPWSNTRNDAYGGSSEKRAKFCLDVAMAIRERCGPDFIVGLKMPADEGVKGGIDPSEAAAITAHLAASGCFDYFAYGQGNFSPSLEDHVPDIHFRPGHFIELHRQMRDAARGIPVMALGRISDPVLAERVVAEGYGELVGMARALVSDAALPNKLINGQPDDVRPCVFDNFCWGEVHAGKPIREFHNPQLGTADEASWSPLQALQPRRITIVGAGPAGLEAAWVAAARGHQVTVFGASAQVGGKLSLEAALPGRTDMGKVVAYQKRLSLRHGVIFNLGRAANANDIRQTEPHAVVLATGARLRPADEIGIEITSESSTLCLSGQELAMRHVSGATPSGGHAVLLDHDHTAPTYALADLLAERFDRLTLLTPRTEIAKGVNYCSALGVHRRLHTAGVDIQVAAQPLRLSGQRLTWANIFSGREQHIEPMDLFVYVTPRRASDDLLKDCENLQAEGVELHSIGDCMSPRNLMIAVHEGHALGNAL